MYCEDAPEERRSEKLRVGPALTVTHGGRVARMTARVPPGARACAFVRIYRSIVHAARLCGADYPRSQPQNFAGNCTLKCMEQASMRAQRRPHLACRLVARFSRCCPYIPHL